VWWRKSEIRTHSGVQISERTVTKSYGATVMITTMRLSLFYKLNKTFNFARRYFIKRGIFISETRSSRGGEDADDAVTPCTLVGRYQRFGATYRLHLQDCSHWSPCSAEGKQYVPPERLHLPTSLPGVTAHSVFFLSEGYLNVCVNCICFLFI
jgi:hypothetical protein